MKVIYLLTLILLSGLVVKAQEPDSLKLEQQQDNLPQITVFAEDLEADNQAQEISGLLQSSSDIYVSTAGYTFGQTRYRIRGYDSENTTVLINGVPVNDRETGRAYWSSWGGLNDATRNKTIETGIGASSEAFGGVGGVTNMITRASSFRKQTKLTYSMTNRSYRNRVMFLYSTGEMKNGWSFAASGSRRWAEEGYVEGTFYDAWSYFVAAEKKINSRHSIGLIGYGAPNRRGRNGVATQEAYDLAGTNYYNAYWGFQNGEKRNSRVANYHQPMIMLSHYWKMDDKSQLTSTLYYTFGRGGSTALDWYTGNDPRPDYYKNMPSDDRDFNGYSYVERAERWENDETFRQLDFDYFYFYNRKNLFTINNADGVQGKTITGNLSNYIIEDRRNDRKNFGFDANYKRELNEHAVFSSGLNLSWFKSDQFKLVEDLMGGDFYLNVDKYAERDDFEDTDYIQNDLNNPNQAVREGDIFGYNYTGNINDYTFFAQTDFTYPKYDFYVGGQLAYNEFWRTGHMRNGKFPDNSYGDSEKQNFFGFGLKGGVTWKITGRHFIEANVLYQSKAPNFRNSYVSPRTRNQVLDNLTNEKISSGDISYIYRSPYIKGRLTGFYTRFEDQVYLRQLYHETLRSFVNYQMTGVDKVHYGTELGIEAKVSQEFTLTGVLGAGNYIYDSRPTTTVSVDNYARVLDSRTIYLKNYKVGGFPQTAMSGGIKYFSSSYIYAGVNFNYYDNIYLDLNPDRRSAEAVQNYAADYPYRDEILEQERLDPAFTIDAYVGKSWRIDYTYYISLNFSISNLMDVQDFAFGGFEQFRYDPFDLDKFAPKYFYLYGRQFYLNLNFRF
ncbi:MAG: TonB-dependent receptor [Bacteroidales bacterium]|nr:TonB-dependent receptor [Bacteroidales bacterium]